MSFQTNSVAILQGGNGKYYETSLTYLKSLHSTTMTTIEFYYEFIFYYLYQK